MKINKTKSVSRDVIDDVVLQNTHRNEEAFNKAKTIPLYQCGVNVTKERLEFDSIVKKNNIKRSMIQDIIDSLRTFEFKEDVTPTIRTLDISGTLNDEVVHLELIKLIKICIASSVNVDESYSEVITEFAKEIMRNPNNLCLPIKLPESNKLHQIVGEELNKLLKQICDENSISYTEEIVVKAKKAKTSKLVDAAKLAGGKNVK